jgi:hypothetical protein
MLHHTWKEEAQILANTLSVETESQIASAS